MLQAELGVSDVVTPMTTQHDALLVNLLKHLLRFVVREGAHGHKRLASRLSKERKGV